MAGVDRAFDGTAANALQLAAAPGSPHDEGLSTHLAVAAPHATTHTGTECNAIMPAAAAHHMMSARMSPADRATAAT